MHDQEKGPTARHTYMVDNLVRNASVVLQDIVVVRSDRTDQLLRHGLVFHCNPISPQPRSELEGEKEQAYQNFL